MANTIRTLIIDNYDSYTFNLFQCAGSTDTPPPVVIRNDQYPWEYVRDAILPFVDNVIVSPGPGSADRVADFGVCAQVLRHARLPILGVCLGHQGICIGEGGHVNPAGVLRHGRMSDIIHGSTGLFAGVPSPFLAVRYHSLVAVNDLPDSLRCTATSGDDKEIMALEHKSRPLWGVQFHPESICTEHGRRILDNFRTLTYRHLLEECKVEFNRPPIPDHIQAMTVIPKPLSPLVKTLNQHPFCPRICHLKITASSPLIFQTLFKDSNTSFWLDSAKLETGLTRFSVMGDLSGPYAYKLEYNSKTQCLTKSFATSKPESIPLASKHGLFPWMAKEMRRITINNGHWKSHSVSDNIADTLPFDFWGGFVGYIGYELKAEALGCTNRSMSREWSTISAEPFPDASFLFADRAIVFDHDQGSVYILALERDDVEGSANIQRDWLEATRVKIINLNTSDSLLAPSRSPTIPASKTHDLPPNFSIRHPREAYIKNIEESLCQITKGETYEVCLTTQIRTKIPTDPAFTPLDFYLHLRTRNPAPYGAFLHFSPDFSIVSSSPERFIKIDREGHLSMKPIKGTVARSTDLEEDQRRRHELELSEKDRAENLMIVDLIRNDLNLISVPHSVAVPSLMKVESYATVHQLVSTVTGDLRKDLNAVDAVAASFPPGSMTGAPKRRTCEILERLEGIPRGVYSGILGFFSLNGAAEFSVVIRTAVLKDGEVSIGAGGAIVALSDPEMEWNEMILKADSVLPSLTSFKSPGSLNSSLPN